YLVAALHREGIDVASEKSGHDLNKGWFSRIKLFVVVFSKPCTYSVACLEKLVKLLEFLREEDNVVVPVFNDAMAKQMDRRNFLERLRHWESLILQISEAAELIEEIAKNVFQKLNPTENIGIHTQLRVQENLLCKQPWGFRSIGILGKPGIGKTTLAEAALRRMRDGYDVPRFIRECNNKITEHFSDEDFQEISVEKFDLNNQDAGPCHRQKRLLLVIDGLQNAQDAESFLSGFNRFGPGSLLIITSSEREVLEKCHLNEIYELKGLDDEDALKLFTRCAFGKDVIDEELRKLSVSEIERCDGNPSTIRSHAEKMKSRMERIDMESALGRFCHISSLCFQETMNSFSITPKQSFFITDAYNYQWDLENFSGFDLACSLEIRLSDLRGQCLNYDSRQKFFFSTISSTYLSDFTDLSLPNFTSPAIESMPIDLKILQLGQETLLVCQVNKPWEGYKVRKL
ncbi:hypothetical protein HID58_006738, partial [Brassica napus]